MRVAWVTEKQLFKGIIGGAEQADQNMILSKPQDVEVRLFRPGQIGPWLETFDRVVVASHNKLLTHEIDYLASLNPVFWAHVFCGEENYRHGKKLFEAARPFIALTPEHLEKEREWLILDDPQVNPGPVHLDGFRPQEQRLEIAIWPHRDVPHKGWDRAHKWALEKGIPIIKMTDQGPWEVLRLMSMVRYFVLLSHIFDAGPRSALEAKLLGCEMVVDNVGCFSGWPDDDVRSYIENATDKFWEVVCS